MKTYENGQTVRVCPDGGLCHEEDHRRLCARYEKMLTEVLFTGGEKMIEKKERVYRDDNLPLRGRDMCDFLMDIMQWTNCVKGEEAEGGHIWKYVDAVESVGVWLSDHDYEIRKIGTTTGPMKVVVTKGPKPDWMKKADAEYKKSTGDT